MDNAEIDGNNAGAPTRSSGNRASNRARCRRRFAHHHVGGIDDRADSRIGLNAGSGDCQPKP